MLTVCKVLVGNRKEQQPNPYLLDIRVSPSLRGYKTENRLIK